jgi:uncharacterized protein (TIGR02246 family)
MFDEPAERRAVLEVGQALQDAWNRGDAAGYASLFADDASFVAWNGVHGYGRQAIGDAHRPLLEGSLAGSRLIVVDDANSARPESLRFVRPDVAIMVTSGAVMLADQAVMGPDHGSVQTFVLVKEGDRWQISAFHNTREQEDREPGAGAVGPVDAESAARPPGRQPAPPPTTIPPAGDDQA